MNIKHLLLAALALSACEQTGDTFYYNEGPGDTYKYSTEVERIEPVLFDSADAINEAAGCTLVEVDIPGDYTIDIVLEQEHYHGEYTVGCAIVGSALDQEIAPPGILMSELMFEYEGIAKTVLVHEMLHTLGLGHHEDYGYYMFSSTYYPAEQFTQSTIDQLQALCK